MSTEFEELKAFLKHHCLTNCGHNANESCICKAALCFKEIEKAERALAELKLIKEAKPSKALKKLERIDDYVDKDYDYCQRGDYAKDYELIKQVLLQAQEAEVLCESLKNHKFTPNVITISLDDYTKFIDQRNVLEILKEKNVDLKYLRDCKTVEEYNKYCDDLTDEKPLTEEGFNTLKMWQKYQ